MHSPVSNDESSQRELMISRSSLDAARSLEQLCIVMAATYQLLACGKRSMTD